MTDAASPKRAPFDPATVDAPTKTITIGGDVFSWDAATDPPWAGEWAFPLNGWDEAFRASWIGTQGHLIAARAEHAATLADGDAFATSPAYLIANAQAEVAEVQRQREIDGRRLDGAKAWMQLRKEHGAANIRSVATVEGDVVIIVGMDAKTIDGANAAARKASEDRLRADPDARILALNEYTGTQRDWVLAQCRHPAHARIKVIAEIHPDLWADLFNARDDMARARVHDEGKGFAP